MIHYHVTARHWLAAILEEGLRTDAQGWDTGYIWFFDDRDLALEQLGQGSWGGYRDLVVLAVDTTGLNVIPDPHPGWGDDRDKHAFATPSNVPATRIRVLEVAQ